MMTETDKAYLAGLIDGEGYITIWHRSGKWSGHQVMMKITNTKIDVLSQIADDFGGHKQIERNRARSKPSIDIHWSARKAVVLLRMVQPYLRIKAEQCRLALEFSEMVRLPNAKARAITPEEWEQREKLRIAIQNLNRRWGAKEPAYIPSPAILKWQQVCQQCGTAFVGARQRKYCSAPCRNTAKLEAFRGRNTRACERCGQEFRARNVKQRFCSHRCGTLAGRWERD
ncbi:MAG: hypothetical protein HYT14_02660 [Candidatus Liptonbacteria bacterium]|nr:hypothetical protein [Candidatus Liptonbacteria bacterium]